MLRAQVLCRCHQTLFDGQSAVHRLGVFPDAAAARAGEVAGVQRLEHQDQRKDLLTGQLLPQQVSGHRASEREGKSHRRREGLGIGD